MSAAAAVTSPMPAWLVPLAEIALNLVREGQEQDPAMAYVHVPSTGELVCIALATPPGVWSFAIQREVQKTRAAEVALVTSMWVSKRTDIMPKDDPDHQHVLSLQYLHADGTARIWWAEYQLDAGGRPYAVQPFQERFGEHVLVLRHLAGVFA